MPPKVFISHASEDKARFVLDFAIRLRGQGVDAWVDTWEILPGDSLVKRIFDEGIGQAQAVIVVLSMQSVEKPWVRDEMETAVIKRINERIRLIPVVLDDCNVPEALIAIKWIRIRDLNHYEAELTQVVDAIFEHRSKPPLGEPPAYTQTAVNRIPGLNATDSLILRLACEEAVRSGHRFISTGQLWNLTEPLGMSKSQVDESLRVLDEMHLIEGHKLQGDGRLRIPAFRISVVGFDLYAQTYVSDYNKLLTGVIAQVVNNGQVSSLKIAQDLDQPRRLVEHVLELLETRRLVTLARTTSFGVRIMTFSPQLARMLAE